MPYPSSAGSASANIGTTSESVRKPCAIVVPNGPAAACSGSVWIHCASSVARANSSILDCSIVRHSESSSWPISCSITIVLAKWPMCTQSPSHHGRGPCVPSPSRKKQDEIPLGELAGPRGAVEREQRVDAAHVAGVVEVRRAWGAEGSHDRVVHRALHV